MTITTGKTMTKTATTTMMASKTRTNGDNKIKKTMRDNLLFSFSAIVSGAKDLIFLAVF